MIKIFLLCYFITFIHFSTSETLIFASLHSRHGARAPLDCDKNDKDFLGEIWTNPGELTSTGQRMEYILGLRNRQRYIVNNKFLSEQFDPHEILVYSTNVNRTIQSISSQLQGLYPLYNKSGYSLTEEQIKESIPPVNTKFDEIQNGIKNLNNSSLPNYMTIIPIHTLSSSERKMNVQDSFGCKEIVNKTRDNNKYNKQIIKDTTKKFNEKYSGKLNEYYDKNPENFRYDFDWIGLLCDTLVSDYSDGRTMKDFFERTRINKEELLEECKNIIKINFRDDFYGDDKNEVILLAESKLMKEVLYYMKLKIDEDIKNENYTLNVSDYSSPKMLIYSGHDSTLTGEELFMIKYFGSEAGLTVENNYIYPTYTTQLTFEVTRDNKKVNMNYSSYNVTFYVNDNILVTIDFDKFQKVIEKNTWNQEKVIEYCEGKKNNQNKNSVQLYIIIGLSLVAFIFLIIIVILIFKIKNKEENKEKSEINGNNKDKGLVSENEDEE